MNFREIYENILNRDDEFSEVYETYDNFWKQNMWSNHKQSTEEVKDRFCNEVAEYAGIEYDRAYKLVDQLNDSERFGQKLSEEELKNILDNGFH